MRTLPRLLAVITLSTAACLSAVGTMAQVVGDSYGALAYSPATGVVAWSHSYPTQRGAERRALEGCANRVGDCRVAIWFKNGCGAVAVGNRGGWGSGWGSSSNRAQNEAIASCRRHTGGCRVIRWQCSGAN